ncbi:hypothetical protein [Photobacterium angustum]|uniref:Uncharacterized protein n=1 Tax=Photobacterium angustum TaxID=661 RepID=A0A2S7VZY7_PHOAN|nr:hypothetical protein [Photobacterium angustum]PQJ67144.1 hypothetical protein BTO08_06890 [Photobacterium angustum]
MSKENLEAWQKAPVKIVSEAINHARKKSEEDNLIAFLLLDVGAEMLLKTYLGLPKKITGSTTSEDERYTIIRKGFHDVVEGVKSSRQGISLKDLARVEFFHGIRNKLYHQGNGLTVQRIHLEEYISVIKVLFKQLLKVDLDKQLSNTSLTKEQAERISQIKEEINNYLSLAKTKIKELELACELIIEEVAPNFLFPSFVKKFNSLLEQACSEEGYTYEGDIVITYKRLPYCTEKRMEIVSRFEELITPLVNKSPYFDMLYRQVEVGNKHQIDAISSQLGIKSIDVERQKVPHILSVIFNDFFDLDVFYKNIVEMVVFNDLYFISRLNYMFFECKDIYPQRHDESDLEYWESTLVLFTSQNAELDNYIARMNSWLESTTKS